ncbi:hypothetical protein D9M69_535510 [compost metagenome]
MVNELTVTAFGRCSGRHSHSPSPVSIIRPSESCTSGRKSPAMGWFSPERNMLVSGAMPRVFTGPAPERRNTRALTVVVVCWPGRITKR